MQVPGFFSFTLFPSIRDSGTTASTTTTPFVSNAAQESAGRGDISIERVEEENSSESSDEPRQGALTRRRVRRGLQVAATELDTALERRKIENEEDGRGRGRERGRERLGKESVDNKAQQVKKKMKSLDGVAKVRRALAKLIAHIDSPILPHSLVISQKYYNLLSRAIAILRNIIHSLLFFNKGIVIQRRR